MVGLIYRRGRDLARARSLMRGVARSHVRGGLSATHEPVELEQRGQRGRYDGMRGRVVWGAAGTERG